MTKDLDFGPLRCSWGDTENCKAMRKIHNPQRRRVLELQLLCVIWPCWPGWPGLHLPPVHPSVHSLPLQMTMGAGGIGDDDSYVGLHGATCGHTGQQPAGWADSVSIACPHISASMWAVSVAAIQVPCCQAANIQPLSTVLSRPGTGYVMTATLLMERCSGLTRTASAWFAPLRCFCLAIAPLHHKAWAVSVCQPGVTAASTGSDAV